MNGAPWNAQQLAQLRQHYPHRPTCEVAATVGRSTNSCYAKAAQLGLKKTPAFFASTSAGRIQRGRENANMMATQFKPGQQPWNKGTHYVAGGRSDLTRFKPGQSPVTTQPIGAYRIVKHYSGLHHLEQKTSNAKGANHMRWTPVSRIVWQAANGPVPTGHLVVFKPGQHTLNPALITPDKLECITRAQLAARNHPGSRSPELARLVQLKGAITRQVNRIQKESQQAHEARKQTAS